MLGFPESTQLPKPVIITKKMIYEKFRDEFTPEKQKRFDEDISRIRLLNEISPRTINISRGKEIENIFVMEIRLKKQDFDEKNLVFISKLIPQNMIFHLVYEPEDAISSQTKFENGNENAENKSASGILEKIVIYYKVLHRTEWMPEDSFKLNLTALDMDKLWENIIIQVGDIKIENKGEITLDTQIEINEKRAALQKKIDELEKKMNKEKQFNRQVEINREIKKLKKEMDELV